MWYIFFFRPFFWSSHLKNIYWILFMYPLATVFDTQDVRRKITFRIFFTSVALTWLVRKDMEHTQPLCSYWWILAPDLTPKEDKYISTLWRPIVSCRTLSFSVCQPNLGDSWCKHPPPLFPERFLFIRSDLRLRNLNC